MLFLLIYIFSSDPVEKVTLSSSNLQKTIAYWKDILELKIFKQTDKSVLLGYSEDQAKVEFEDIGRSLLLVSLIMNILIMRVFISIKLFILFN